jgi:hypothetical protein
MDRLDGCNKGSGSPILAAVLSVAVIFPNDESLPPDKSGSTSEVGSTQRFFFVMAALGEAEVEAVMVATEYKINACVSVGSMLQ